MKGGEVTKSVMELNDVYNNPYQNASTSYSNPSNFGTRNQSTSVMWNATI